MNTSRRIKRSELSRLATQCGLTSGRMLEALRLVADTISTAPHGIASQASIECALQEGGINVAEALLKELAATGTIVWSYGCIEGWRMA